MLDALLRLQARLRTLFLTYGRVALGVWFSVFALTWLGFYLALGAGLDLAALRPHHLAGDLSMAEASALKHLDGQPALVQPATARLVVQLHLERNVRKVRLRGTERAERAAEVVQRHRSAVRP